MPGHIKVERVDAIATVILDHQEKLNAMSKPMWLALSAAMASLSADDSIRCVILRGAGEKAFCAGADIAEFENERANSTQATEYGHVVQAAINTVWHCRHPVVACIHGHCVGGGLLIATLCDIRICGTSSRFGIPVRTLGLVEAYGEIAPLVRLAGADAALEILLEGRVFGAEEAREKRLVTRVVADAEVAREALASAQRIAEGAPLVARWHKKFVRRLGDPRPVSEEEARECFACFDTEDFRIGWTAFLAKQKPVFVSR